MFSRSERLLIKRFLFSKKTDGYISIFSWFSIVGISLGVAAIIIVMSVMNGFRSDLTNRMLNINSHINIFSYSSKIENKNINIIKSNLNNNNITSIFKTIETNGIIVIDDISKGVLIRGYENFTSDHYLYNKLFNEVHILNSAQIIIGDYLSKYLGVEIGDEIKIAIPKSDKTILGNIPRFKTLKVVNIFDFGLYEYDANLVFISAELSRKLLMYDDNVFNKIEIYTNKPHKINIIKDNLYKIINEHNLNLYPVSWKDRNSTLINALNVEKNVMFLILTLIILVASMNIISGLIIFVKEKNKDIGILKTFGTSNYSIIKIFFSIGVIIGLIGALIGLVVGIIFTINIQYIQKFLENFLDTKLFAEEIYFLSSLPYEIKIQEVIIVFFTSIFISTLATIFPAIRSAKVDPIISIRSE